MDEGIYFNLPEADYHAAEGLSNSGMKDLYVSPLNYWHKHYNPKKKPEEDTRAKVFGSALHCRLLEPQRFFESYARQISESDYPDALVTVEDLKAACKSSGLSSTCKRKQELIDRLSGSDFVIWDVLAEEYAYEHRGKTLLSADEWDLIQGAADVALSDTYIAAILQQGWPEVSIFVRDESGVMLKCRIDWMRLNCSVDLKSFNNARGKKAEKAVTDTLYYEGYYNQAEFYSHVRNLARQGLAEGKIQAHGAPEGFEEGFIETPDTAFVLVFIESDEPFHLAMKVLKEREYEKGEPNIYWSSAASRRIQMTELFQECQRKYGDKQWREPCKPEVLTDLDLPQLMFN